MNEITTEMSLQNLINSMGWDEDDNFNETANRVMCWLRDYQSLTVSECESKSKLDLSKRFKTKAENMVHVGPTKVFSLCPHHLLPIEYDVYIAYIPNNEVVGLSKLSRVPQNFARYPFIQEEFTEKIADCIEKYLKPKGCMIIAKGVHNCMRMRGVKQPNAYTMTSAIRGVFKDPPKGKNPRQEFLELLKIGR